MKTSGPKFLIVVLTTSTVALVSPPVVSGQTTSARPASVALTVVVPPRARLAEAVQRGETATILRRTTNSVELEARVGITDRLTSRVEVQLGAVWPADSGRVWVRNSAGEFERLIAGTSVIAVDLPPALATAGPALSFRVESDGPLPLTSLAVPVDYRLRVGSGDRFAVWRFESLVRVDLAR